MRLEPSGRESIQDDPGDEPANAPAARRFTLRAIIPPELCVVAFLFVLLAAGISLSSMNVSGDESGRDQSPLHKSRIEGLAFSPDGRTAASASRDGTVRVWDVTTRHARSFELKGAWGFSSVAFSPDGTQVAAGGLDGKVSVWDASTGDEVASLTAGAGAVRSVAFTPDGGTIVAGGDDSTIRLWDRSSGRELMVLRGHTETVDALTFSADGKTLVSAGHDGRVILWDVRSGRVREEFPAEVGRLWSVSLAPDGRSLAVGGSEGIMVRALSTGTVRRWSCPKGAVTVVHYFPDGATLASCSLDGAVDLWDIARDRVLPRCSLSGQTCRVKAMAVSPDGTTIVSGGDDAKLRIWELAGQSTLASLIPAVR